MHINQWYRLMEKRKESVQTKIESMAHIIMLHGRFERVIGYPQPTIPHREHSWSEFRGTPPTRRTKVNKKKCWFSYYHRVLVLPPTHVGDPSPQIIMPTTQPIITTTTQVENNDDSSFSREYCRLPLQRIHSLLRNRLLRQKNHRPLRD